VILSEAAPSDQWLMTKTLKVWEFRFNTITIETAD